MLNSAARSNGARGNIESDPLLAADGWLQSGSPCIDAGCDTGVTTDIEGHVRPFDVPGVDNNGPLPDFDMGAYEYVGSSTKKSAD